MQTVTLATRLAAWQAPEGAFLSTIAFPNRRETDCNGFVTALVLRALRGLPTAPELDRVRGRALDFLERCASTTLPGAFSFWPADTRPRWASQVPEDADDTAVMALELSRYGRLSRQDLLRILCKVLITHRVPRLSGPGPPWILPGAFLTWLAANPHRPNVVDSCVNANIAALMAYVSATHLPGYQEACSMIETGLRWAGSSWSRLRSLTPFYPHPHEFYCAVQHAVECGAWPLRSALDRLSVCTRDARATNDPPVCSSAYGHVMWYCPALVEVRHYHEHHQGIPLSSPSPACVVGPAPAAALGPAGTGER